jgi:hypothetical protein
MEGRASMIFERHDGIELSPGVIALAAIVVVIILL